LRLLPLSVHTLGHQTNSNAATGGNACGPMFWSRRVSFFAHRGQAAAIARTRFCPSEARDFALSSGLPYWFLIVRIDCALDVARNRRRCAHTTSRNRNATFKLSHDKRTTTSAPNCHQPDAIAWRRRMNERRVPLERSLGGKASV
jgi:hypothetical protein